MQLELSNYFVKDGDEPNFRRQNFHYVGPLSAVSPVASGTISFLPKGARLPSKITLFIAQGHVRNTRHLSYFPRDFLNLYETSGSDAWFLYYIPKRWSKRTTKAKFEGSASENLSYRRSTNSYLGLVVSLDFGRLDYFDILQYWVLSLFKVIPGGSRDNGSQGEIDY